MKEKLNWKSKIISDLIDLKSIRDNNKDNDKTKKDDNTSKSSLSNKSPTKTKANNSSISVSINKSLPRNQRWKTSLINKIKEDLFNNDSNLFDDILKKVNDKKEKEKKRKLENDKKIETIVIDDDDKNDNTLNEDHLSAKPFKKKDKKLNDIIDDDIIIVDNKNKKRKRTNTKSKKKIENPDKENEKKNEKENDKEKEKEKEKDDNNKPVKRRRKTKKDKILKEEENTKKVKALPEVQKIKYPVLSKMENLNEKFELTYILRPNSKREHAELDDSVCIWDCAFEPTIEGQDASHIVATCGANTVSMIECHTGKVIAKYTNLIEVENYYSLDWTVVKVNSEYQQNQNNEETKEKNEETNNKKKITKKKTKKQDENNKNDNDDMIIDNNNNNNGRSQYCPILAAGGQLGEIIFLNRMQGECFRYAEPKVSKPQPITQLRFSKDNPKWLFAGSEDKFVYLYDIGELNDTEQDSATNLAKFVGLKKDPTAINVNKNNLIVGCSDGAIIVYNLSNIPSVEEAKKSNHLINISISHKFSSLHNTYIDDIIPYSPQYHLENSFTNTFFTRGAKDHITLWSVANLDTPTQKKTNSKKNSKKSESISEELKPTTISELEWSHYVECVRFSLVNDEDETLLLTGSGAGDINIYKLKEDKSLQLISTFKHEQSGEAIHKVVLSKDKKYLVGVNEINLAFIWKLK